jgi:signal transduction histidine kinase
MLGLITSSTNERPTSVALSRRPRPGALTSARLSIYLSAVINFSLRLTEQHHLRDVQPAMSIKPLPADVVAQIKSSVVITSLNNVICGLIKNSLDAEATKINLSVDYSRGNCSIEDNGTGIPPSEFRDDGGLGQLHCM